MKLTTKPGRNNKIHIFADEEYSLTVDSEYWYTSPWCVKKEIDEEDFESVKLNRESSLADK